MARGQHVQRIEWLAQGCEAGRFALGYRGPSEDASRAEPAERRVANDWTARPPTRLSMQYFATQRSLTGA